MTTYEILIHLRDSTEPTRIALPGVSEQDAEADRKTLMHDIEEARSVEVPAFELRTASGFPAEPLVVDPHAVTEVDLVEGSADGA